jgi:hypothetical protein
MLTDDHTAYHNIRERQRIVTERVLRSLGYDPSPGAYGYGNEQMESIGSIKLYHKKSPSFGSIYPAGGGTAPGFGPLGTPLRRSEDDAYRSMPGSAGLSMREPQRGEK